MPKKLTIYDKETGEALERFAVTAREAVANDPARYSLAKPKNLAVSERDKAKVAKGKRTTSGPLKADPVDREDTGARPPDESAETDKDETDKE